MAQTLYTNCLIVVIQAQLQAAANAKALELDTLGGDRTFTQGLSPSGALPATHYWCDWTMLPGEEVPLRGKLANVGSGNKVRVYNGKTTTPEQVLALTGLKDITEP